LRTGGRAAIGDLATTFPAGGFVIVEVLGRSVPSKLADGFVGTGVSGRGSGACGLRSDWFVVVMASPSGK